MKSKVSSTDVRRGHVAVCRRGICRRVRRYDRGLQERRRKRLRSSRTAYGYAVFPTIGKGGLGVGAAHGSGRVYEQGKYVGDVKMNQVSVGLQAGGQAFSQIIFFQDKRSFDEFIERQLRVRRDGPGRGDHRLGNCQRRIDGHERGRGRRTERCEHGREVSQGDGRVHRRQGRADVSGRGRRAEVQVQGEEVVRQRGIVRAHEKAPPLGGAFAFSDSATDRFRSALRLEGLHLSVEAVGHLHEFGCPRRLSSRCSSRTRGTLPCRS